MWQDLAVKHTVHCVGMDAKAKNFPVTVVINMEVTGDHKLKARHELLQRKLASYLVLQTEYLMRECEVTPWL